MVAGRVVGVAMLTRGRRQRRGPLPIRTLHLGTAGELPGESVWVEYNRLLVEPRYRTAFLTTLLDAPGAAKWSADTIELNGFAPEEVPKAAIKGCVIEEQICHIARLAPDAHGAATLLDTFDRDTRRKIRKYLTRFTDAYGPVQTEWVDDVARAQVVFDELIANHQARWASAGEAGAFASPRFQAFHRALIGKLLGKGRIALVRVTAGETLVGIFYGFIENGVIYHYQWGLPQLGDKSLAPGFVTGFKVMEDAAAWGFAELNWLAGDSRYKREMSNTTRTLVWAEKGLSPWFTAVNGMIRIKHALRGRT
jgi:CelD/BcsL family acetyltransferase involved in cellulose biosynthesis